MGNKYDALLAYDEKKYGSLIDYSTTTEKPTRESVLSEFQALPKEEKTPEKRTEIQSRLKEFQVEKPKGMLEKGLGKTFAGLGGFAEGAGFGVGRLLHDPLTGKPLKETIEETKKEHPLAFGAGEIASYIAPTTGPAKLFKGAGKLASKILPKTTPKLLRTATQAGITGGVRETIKGTTETGDIKEGVKRGLLAAPIEAAAGGLTEAASIGLGKAGGAVLKKILPGKKMIPKGFKPEHIKELKVGGSVKETLKKATKKSGEVGKKIDDIMEKAVDPQIRFNPEKSFITVKKNIYKIEEVAGSEKEVLRAIEKIYKDSIKPRGFTGKDLNAQQMRDLRKIIGKIAFPKSVEIRQADPIKVKAAKLLYYDMMEDIAIKIPEVVKHNKNYHKLKNIIDVADQAIESSTTRKGIPMSDMFRTALFLTGGGAYIGGQEELGTAIGLGALGSKALMTGKGAQTLSGLSGLLGKEAFKRGVSGLAGKQAARLRFGKEEEEEEKKRRRR
jgi:hypothetical protein